jgi:hypothetical protein
MGRPDLPCPGNSKPGTRSPSSLTLIHRVSQSRVAAHHNPGIRNVKYKIWCNLNAGTAKFVGGRFNSEFLLHVPSCPWWLMPFADSGKEDGAPARLPFLLHGIEAKIFNHKGHEGPQRKASAGSCARIKRLQIRSAPNSRELWDARTALPQVCSRKRYGPPAKVYIPLSCQCPGTNRP